MTDKDRDYALILVAAALLGLAAVVIAMVANAEARTRRLTLDDYTPAYMDGLVAGAAVEWGGVRYARREYREDCEGLTSKPGHVVVCAGTRGGPNVDGVARIGHRPTRITLSPEGPLQRLQTLHEIGHALGLEHNHRGYSIMHPWLTGDERITPADRKARREAGKR